MLCLVWFGSVFCVLIENGRIAKVAVRRWFKMVSAGDDDDDESRWCFDCVCFFLVRSGGWFVDRGWVSLAGGSE